jgi:hypothetical protein
MLSLRRKRLKSADPRSASSTVVDALSLKASPGITSIENGTWESGSGARVALTVIGSKLWTWAWATVATRSASLGKRRTGLLGRMGPQNNQQGWGFFQLDVEE